MKNPKSRVNGTLNKPAPRVIPIQFGSRYLLSDKNNKKLGEVVVEKAKKGWFFGKFTESPSFRKIKPLFDEHREVVNQQIFSRVEKLEDDIATLGLHLVNGDSEVVHPIKNVQIGLSSIDFQISENL
jgi:hypothetical protein